MKDLIFLFGWSTPLTSSNDFHCGTAPWSIKTASLSRALQVLSDEKNKRSFNSASFSSSPLPKTLGGKFCFIEHFTKQNSRGPSEKSVPGLWPLVSCQSWTLKAICCEFCQTGCRIPGQPFFLVFLFCAHHLRGHCCFKEPEIPSLSIRMCDKSGHS